MLTKGAVVVIPVYKTSLTNFEAISVRQCFKVLSKYDICFICPERLKDDPFFKAYPEAGVLSLDDSHFQSIGSYNSLMLSTFFYEKFQTYQYMLIYQTDSFVFKDTLGEWVKRGYSYVGPPWFTNQGNYDTGNHLEAVGNGGLSLRNIEDTLQVLRSSKRFFSLRRYFSREGRGYNPVYWAMGLFRFFYRNKFNEAYKNAIYNEDTLFSVAGEKFDFFKIPTPQEALQFGFEEQPRKMFAMNKSELPFGCHAWWKYDLVFFKPFIEDCGHELVNEPPVNEIPDTTNLFTKELI
jgi:hypothetical protein